MVKGDEVPVAARLPPTQIAVIDSQAKALGITRSEMIRRILSDWTARLTKDLADEGGGVGEGALGRLTVIDRDELGELKDFAQWGLDLNLAIGRIQDIVHKHTGVKYSYGGEPCKCGEEDSS